MEPSVENPAQNTQACYGLEVLCANWNPLVAGLGEPAEVCRDFAAELATADADSFLATFYRFQQG
jgi:hypothetical protein